MSLGYKNHTNSSLLNNEIPANGMPQGPCLKTELNDLFILGCSTQTFGNLGVPIIPPVGTPFENQFADLEALHLPIFPTDPFPGGYASACPPPVMGGMANLPHSFDPILTEVSPAMEYVACSPDVFNFGSPTSSYCSTVEEVRSPESDEASVGASDSLSSTESVGSPKSDEKMVQASRTYRKRGRKSKQNLPGFEGLSPEEIRRKKEREAKARSRAKQNERISKLKDENSRLKKESDLLRRRQLDLKREMEYLISLGEMTSE
eukprot:Nk52_evm28s207 gene=Nk52_evmTU28s207